MKGRWTDIVNTDGTPKDSEFFAYDSEMTSNAVSSTFEQMYGMIWSLANSMAMEIEGPGSAHDRRALRLDLIKSAVADSERGVEFGKTIGT